VPEPSPAPSADAVQTGPAPVVIGLLRIVVGLFFLLPGSAKFTMHAEEVELFDRWGVPAPDLAVTATGVVEILGGLALAAGVLMPLPAAALAATMVGALVTAGRVDGGQHIVLPLVLIVLLAVVVAGRGGRWQVTQPLASRRRTPEPSAQSPSAE
jgi:uncharacterized membrane protein YphA (DoxX/SURF4 family)